MVADDDCGAEKVFSTFVEDACRNAGNVFQQPTRYFLDIRMITKSLVFGYPMRVEEDEKAQLDEQHHNEKKQQHTHGEHRSDESFGPSVHEGNAAQHGIQYRDAGEIIVRSEVTDAL